MLASVLHTRDDIPFIILVLVLQLANSKILNIKLIHIFPDCVDSTNVSIDPPQTILWLYYSFFHYVHLEL